MGDEVTTVVVLLIVIGGRGRLDGMVVVAVKSSKGGVEGTHGCGSGGDDALGGTGDVGEDGRGHGDVG